MGRTTSLPMGRCLLGRCAPATACWMCEAGAPSACPTLCGTHTQATQPTWPSSGRCVHCLSQLHAVSELCSSTGMCCCFGHIPVFVIGPGKGPIMFGDIFFFTIILLNSNPFPHLHPCPSPPCPPRAPSPTPPLGPHCCSLMWFKEHRLV